MKIIIGEHVYTGDRRYVNNCLTTVGDKFRKENANAIYAIEKDNIIHMMRETFSDSSELFITMEKYDKLGFICYYCVKE